MKNLRITMAVLLFSLTAVSPMADAQGLAVKAGVNLTTWSGNDVEDAEFRTGVTLGVSYRVKASEKLFFAPGLCFVQRGVKSSDRISEEYYQDVVIDYAYSQEIRTNYLDIPMALQYYLDEALFLSIQPTLSFLIKNDYQSVFTSCYDGSCTGSNEEGEFDEFKETDFTLGLGFGYSITNRVAIQTAYQIGLLRIDQEDDADLFNRSVAFAIEYRF